MDLFLIDPEDLPFEERMKIKGAWPDMVSIADLAEACYPNDMILKKMLIKNIVKLCKSGDLQCFGDIEGWAWGRCLYSDDSFAPIGESKNPYPGTSGASLSSGDLMQDIMSNGDKWRAAPSNCLIHKDEFKRYLQSDQSAIGYLVNWWSETEDADNAGAGSQGGIEPKEPTLTKLQKQQAAILEVIKAELFDPMAIPDGKKAGTIQRICENNHAKMFNGSTSFDRAWDLGLKSGLWRMEYHESYARRGNN